VLAETVEKPSYDRSAKERRNLLFRVLDGVLAISHKKIHSSGNSDKQKQGWARVLVSAVSTYGAILKDVELDSLEERLILLEQDVRR